MQLSCLQVASGRGARRGAMDEKEPCKEAVTTTETDDTDLLLDLKVLRSGFSPTSDNKLVLDGYMEAFIEMNK